MKHPNKANSLGRQKRCSFLTPPLPPVIGSDGVDASRHAIAADSIRLLSGASRLPSSGFTRQNLFMTPAGSCPDFAGDPQRTSQLELGANTFFAI